MRRAGYEIIEDILLSLIDNKVKSVKEIADSSHLEWHEAKIYLEFMSNWGLVKKEKLRKADRYVISQMVRNHFIMSVKRGDWAKSIAEVFNRLVISNRIEKANYILLRGISDLFRLFQKNVSDQKDVLVSIGVLIHSIDYHSKVLPEILEALTLEELESHRFYKDNYVANKVLGEIQGRLSSLISEKIRRRKRRRRILKRILQDNLDLSFVSIRKDLSNTLSFSSVDIKLMDYLFSSNSNISFIPKFEKFELSKTQQYFT